MKDRGSPPSTFRVSLRHLHLFESVARLSSVRRAARECNLSQPAVSQAVSKLEDQVGVALLDRLASGTCVNAFGVIFHRRVQRLFGQVEQALVELGVSDGSTPLRLIASRITRSHIRSLSAIVEFGSFAQAARVLQVSPIPLQRAARDLERILRIPLCASTVLGLTATAAGCEFARKLKVALRELGSAAVELEEAKGNNGGRIVIGVMLLSGSRVLASVLNEFVHTYPNMSIDILSGSAEDMLHALRNGDADFVIGRLRKAMSDDLVSQPLTETPYVIAARKGHPLIGKGKATLAELSRYEWVVGTPGASRRTTFDTLFAGQERPRARLATCSLPIIYSLLADDDYLALLTSNELVPEESALTTVPFGPILEVPLIGLMTRANWLPTQLQQRFIDLVKVKTVDTRVAVRKLRRAS